MKESVEVALELGEVVVSTGVVEAAVVLLSGVPVAYRLPCLPAL